MYTHLARLLDQVRPPAEVRGVLSCLTLLCSRKRLNPDSGVGVETGQYMEQTLHVTSGAQGRSNLDYPSRTQALYPHFGTEKIQTSLELENFMLTHNGKISSQATVLFVIIAV